MAAHDPLVYLLHMRDACERLTDCSVLRDAGTVPAWILLDAVCRNLEVLGEASRKVGSEFRAAHSAIPWREMNDLRNVLIHNYDVADADLIWGIVESEFPGCSRNCANCCRQRPADGRTFA
jgi:uncharacterized protein with HEPN domain